MRTMTFAEWLAKYENDRLMGVAHFGISNLSKVTDEIDYHRVARILTSKIDAITELVKW